MKRLCFSFITLLLFSFTGNAKNISPLDFGLESAHTGVERYEILMRTHKAAIARGFGVSYRGIRNIELVIPQNAKPIPLPLVTDFTGVEINVVNNVKNACLFTLCNELTPLSVTLAKLKRGNFTSYQSLRRGENLLVIIDKKPWVIQRRGYKNGATRKDILYIVNGRAKNGVTASYSTSSSLPQYYYCNVTNQEIVIENLSFTRSKESSYITRLFELKNLNNVNVKNIIINTPDGSGLYGETAIYIENSTNVTFEDVTINGTYSLKDKYGYGIGMNNVWNSCFVRLKATGNWGVFGNNNVSHATLENCDINRFDIHCYGKNVYCKNTIFRDLYNQFSSFYGTLRYEKCKFLNFVPVLLEPSYSAYTYFKLEVENCSIEVDVKRPYLINAGYPSVLAEDARTELSIVRWPDISIMNSTVNLPSGVKYWTLFHSKGKDNVSIEGFSSVSIEGLKIKGQSNKPSVRLSNKKMRLKKKLKTTIIKSDIQSIE